VRDVLTKACAGIGILALIILAYLMLTSEQFESFVDTHEEMQREIHSHHNHHWD